MGMRDATQSSISASMREFLRWIDASPRSYAATMEAWQTTCPQFSVWEDATIAGYVFLRGVGREQMVLLSDLGRSALRDATPSS